MINTGEPTYNETLVLDYAKDEMQLNHLAWHGKAEKLEGRKKEKKNQA